MNKMRYRVLDRIHLFLAVWNNQKIHDTNDRRDIIHNLIQKIEKPKDFDEWVIDLDASELHRMQGKNGEGTGIGGWIIFFWNICLWISEPIQLHIEFGTAIMGLKLKRTVTTETHL